MNDRANATADPTLDDIVNALRDPLHAVDGLSELLATASADTSIAALSTGLRNEIVKLSEVVHQLFGYIEAAGTPDDDMTSATDGSVVLVVDDNPVNQQLTSSQLERLGYDCAVVSSGTEALDWLEVHQAGLVLMDWHMAELDGLETTREVRRREGDAALPRVPIVALTARAMAGDRETCLAAGMDDFLAKPASLEDLRLSLSTWHTSGPVEKSPTTLSARQSTASDGQKIVNTDTLFELIEKLDDRDHLRRLLKAYQEELSTGTANVMSSHRLNQMAIITQVAHDLRSMSSLFGAEIMASILEALEASAGAGDDVSALIAELRVIEPATRHAIQAFVDGQLPQGR